MKQFVAALVTALISTQTFAEQNSPEKLNGFYYDETGVTFQVSSNGCTDKEDFELLSQPTYPPRVFLVRTTPDNCRAYIRYGVEIKFTWDELGGGTFHVGNPLDVVHGPVRRQ